MSGLGRGGNPEPPRTSRPEPDQDAIIEQQRVAFEARKAQDRLYRETVERLRASAPGDWDSQSAAIDRARRLVWPERYDVRPHGRHKRLPVRRCFVDCERCAWGKIAFMVSKGGPNEVGIGMAWGFLAGFVADTGETYVNDHANVVIWRCPQCGAAVLPRRSQHDPEPECAAHPGEALVKWSHSLEVALRLARAAKDAGEELEHLAERVTPEQVADTNLGDVALCSLYVMRWEGER